MDPRICKNNYYNVNCTTKHCSKFHLRRNIKEETVLIDTYTNFFQHNEIKKTKTVPASFPPGIKLHVLNITDRPAQWSSPIQQTNMTMHNVLGFHNLNDTCIQWDSDLLTDVKQTFSALLDTRDRLYSALSINIDAHDISSSNVPAGATLLNSTIDQYKAKSINPSVPLYIQAAEPDIHLYALLNHEALKYTPIIWRNHNSMNNNYNKSFPNSSNHYFQINPSSKTASITEITRLIKNNMLCKLIPTSRTGSRTFQPHELLTTLCNIHQAILDSGTRQELYTTNERLIDNTLCIFPHLLSNATTNGNPKIMRDRATANMAKWFNYLEPKPKITSFEFTYTQKPTSIPPSALMDLNDLQPTYKTSHHQRDLKRRRTSPKPQSPVPTNRNTKKILPTINPDGTCSYKWNIDQQGDIMSRIINDEDFKAFMQIKIAEYLQSKRTKQPLALPAPPAPGQ
jgi:hypothetical protein